MIRPAGPAIAASLLAAPLLAQDLRLLPPVACPEDGLCFIQNYVDRDPTSGVADFQCGTRSFDGHKGTDFALPYLSDITRGVVVRAAAAGTVLRVRDGMADVPITAENAPDITGRECGNGLVIDHGQGWETQYCHLRQGTLQVTEGQEVAAGDPLGSIGLSGNTEFAHLQLIVRKDGAVVDPFAPAGAVICGGPAQTPLWTEPVATASGGLLTAGIAPALPEFDEVTSGQAAAVGVTQESPALVFWIMGFNGLRGDTIQLLVIGPDGPFAGGSATLERNRARFFRAAGKRLPEELDRWPAGTYDAAALLLRDGAEISRITTRLTLP